MKWLSGSEQQRPSPAAYSGGSSSSGGSAGGAAASSASPPLPPPGGNGSGLIDASAASRAAALGTSIPAHGRNGSRGEGGGSGGEVGAVGGPGGAGETAAAAAVGGRGAGPARLAGVDPADMPHEYDAASVLALSELLSVLLRRWGTGANASNQVMQVRSQCHVILERAEGLAGVQWAWGPWGGVGGWGGEGRFGMCACNHTMVGIIRAIDPCIPIMPGRRRVQWNEAVVATLFFLFFFFLPSRLYLPMLLFAPSHVTCTSNASLGAVLGGGYGRRAHVRVFFRMRGARTPSSKLFESLLAPRVRLPGWR